MTDKLNPAQKFRQDISRRMRGEVVEPTKGIEGISAQDLDEMARGAPPRTPAAQAVQRAVDVQRAVAPFLQPDTARDWRIALISKFPSFDPAWSPKMKLEWFQAFDRLFDKLNSTKTRK